MSYDDLIAEQEKELLASFHNNANNNELESDDDLPINYGDNSDNRFALDEVFDAIEHLREVYNDGNYDAFEEVELAIVLLLTKAA